MLVLSVGLQATGAVQWLTALILPARAAPAVSIVALIIVAATLSAFMNNVGALALLMPVALQLAAREGIPPGRVLMPLAFGSILGGMTTMIGTPPNLIVAGFRAEAVGESFAMFDFAPVGILVVLAGLVFVGLAARFLVPVRGRAGIAGFETSAYVTEARVTVGSRAAGMTLAEVEQLLAEVEALVIGLVRNGSHIAAPNRFREIHVGDVLQIQADHDKLLKVIDDLELALEETAGDSGAAEAGEQDDRSAGDGAADRSASAARAAARARRDLELAELVVLPGSVLSGRSVEDVRVRSRFGLNLLAISRQGVDAMTRLKSERLRTGDVLLLQGDEESIAAFATRYACAPLASRALRMPVRTLAAPAMAIMGGTIALAAFGILPPATAFAVGVLAYLLLGIVSPRELYQSVDWPVIVLLGALIPVAGVMSTTGAADLIARWLLDTVAQGSPMLGLALILIVTMTLSDFMNNAATSAVMCPIAIGTAERLGGSPDPFLMAVAVGASCAFLTPIGHQNNTLILGPGGFRFGDYWRLGLPLEVVVVAVAVPAIAWFWPFG